MNKLDFKKIKKSTEHAVDPNNKGCLHTLTFKVLCGLTVILALGMLYNWIVRDDNPDVTEQEQEEKVVREAQRDTLDVVGDYLWKEPAIRPGDVVPDEHKEEEEQLKEKAKREVEEEARKAKEDAMKAETEVSGTEVQESQVSSSSNGPTVEKVEAPKVAPIE